MKQNLLKTWLILMCLLVGVGTTWAEEVTYTITSKSEVSTAGTAPLGTSATFANTYSTKDQLTKGNTMTLTLSGYAGKKITKILLSMKSNSSAGAGYLSVTAGTTTLASIGSSSSGVAFNNASWNGSYTTTYTNVTPTMSNSSYAIQNGENVVIVIGATTNSLYCQSFKITYEDAVADNRTAVNMTAFSAVSSTIIKGGTTETSVTNDQSSWTPSYTYQSDKTDVATVDANGVITAVSKGTAKITASLNIASNDTDWKKGATSSKSIEITVNNPSHNYTFYSNGTEVSTGSCEEGEAITFPSSDPEDINDKKFVGWAETTIDGSTDTAPTFVTSGTMESSDINYYAVFASVTGSSTDEWVEIISVPEDGTYAICSESYFMKAAISNNRFANGSETPQIEDGKLTVAPAADCQWKIFKDGTYYRIKNGDMYAAATGSKNQGSLRESISGDNDNPSKWTITYSNNQFNIINYARSQASTDSGNKYLRNNTTNGWATYASTTGAAPRLFKKVGGTTYSDFCTTVGEAKPLDHINVTGAKTLYKVGETFSTDGMTVTAYYDAEENDSKTISTGYTVSKTEALTAEDNTITISYTEGEVTKTADVAINVVALENIAITTAPTKVEYTEGEDFDKTGMVVTGTWGTTAPNVIEEAIEDYNVTDGTGLAADQTSVTISYDGKEATQAITVTALPRYTLHITPTTDGTVYTVKAGDQVLSEGAQILYGTNLTCECDESTVPEGYYFSRFYIDFGGDKERYMSSNPATFTTQIPTEGFTELTVRCSILEQKRYTVHFDAQAGYVKPKLLTETAFQSGVVLPEATCENGLWQFAGWADAATEETSTAPTLYKAGDTYKPTESTTLYAVYKQGTESGETAFNRVTDISELTDGKKVVIVSNSTNRVLTLTGGDTHTQTDGASITESDGKYIWTIGKEGDIYTFTDENSTHRVLSFQSTPKPGSNQTGISKADTNSKKEWTISAASETNCWIITNTEESSESGKAALYIANNTASWGALNLLNSDRETREDLTAFAMRIYVEGPATSITYNSNPEFTLLAFNEANTAITGETGSYNRVTVTRALKADTWNSFCVPFNMSAEQIEDNFGAGAQVKQLDNISLKNGENLYLTFTDAATIECGKPYLVRVSEAVPEILVHNASVNIAEPTVVAPTCKNDEENTTYTVSFQGNYTKMSVPMDSYIISSDKFYHVDSALSMKGFRGYFTTTATDNSGNEVKALDLTFGFEDPTTALENVTVEGLDDARTYDMQGRIVTKVQKNHIYIKNGRKFLAK